ncbi:MAG: DUF4309 domain-containing protein [Oscillospiraceae bacterium]|jgi:hypothetical protein
MDKKESKQSPKSYTADYRASFEHKKDNASPPKKRQRKSNVSKAESVSQLSQKRRARLENDTEIDDFLPENDDIDEERLLTKWDDGMGTTAPAKVKPRRRGRHRYGIFVGTIVLIFALCGVGFLATTIGMKIHAVLTDDTQQRLYDQFLTVVVAQDPPPFDSPEEADPDFVLNASLWQTMTGDSASTYTEYDDAGRTLVPLGDVVEACHQLFGPDCQLQPQNPTEETFFEYDSENAQFHVALYSLDSTYTPYTEEIKKKGDMVVLRVGYVPPSDETRAQSFGSVSSDVKPKPVKYMEYDLKTNPSTQEQYIYAIKELPES